MVRANRGAALDTLAWHLDAHPRSRVFGGLSFMLGGSTALERVAPGVRQGDLSGIAAAEVPGFLARLELAAAAARAGGRLGPQAQRRWRRKRRPPPSAC